MAACLTTLESDKTPHTLTDDQLIERIAESTCQLDPLEWPQGYELSDKLVLVSKDMGRIWVPRHEELQ